VDLRSKDLTLFAQMNQIGFRKEITTREKTTIRGWKEPNRTIMPNFERHLIYLELFFDVLPSS